EAKRTPPRPSRTAPVTPAPLELACKPAGAPLAVLSTPGFDTVDNRANDVRWFAVKDEKDHKVSVVVGGRTGARELPLLGPEPPKPATTLANVSLHHTVISKSNDGVVAIRSASAAVPSETTDLEIAWWSV